MLICVTDIVLKLMFLIYAWKYFLIVIYVIQDNYFFFIFLLTRSHHLLWILVPSYHFNKYVITTLSYKYIKLGLWCCWFCYNYVIYIVVHLYQSCIYKEVAHEVQPSVSPMFLPDFNIFCDLSLYRPSQ